MAYQPVLFGIAHFNSDHQYFSGLTCVIAAVWRQLFFGGSRMKKNKKETIIHTMRNKKGVLTVYLILRFFVIATLVLQIVERDYESALVCVLTLFLFMLPSVLERRLHVELPDALEIVILCFIFAAEILGEIREFYVLVPHWDTVLHTINGFLFAAIGFCIVNLLNTNKRVSMTLSPFYMAVAAFCFSMTIGVMWEFFEWGMDTLFDLDMQKDTLVRELHTVLLHPDGRNKVVSLREITDIVVVLQDGTQCTLGLGGYVDIGLIDTMKDLFVNLIGAVIFSVIGYFYVKTNGKGKVAKMFIPTVLDRGEET